VENKDAYTYIRIAVFIDAQSAAGMLREDIHDASFGEFGQLT
jgi:hypothetical protein